jgi:hypothetical protein
VSRWMSPIAVLLAAAAPAGAHHSISGVYDSARQRTVEGHVTEFRFVNPHPILIIEVSAGAAAQTWQLEMDNRFELAEIGITENTYKQGDRVVASGSLARTEPQRLYLRRLQRSADGLVYEQIGSSPRVNARPPE